MVLDGEVLHPAFPRVSVDTGSTSHSLSTIIPSTFHSFNVSSPLLSHSHSNLRSVPFLKWPSLDSASSSGYCFFLLPFERPVFTAVSCILHFLASLILPRPWVAYWFLQSGTLQLFQGIPAFLHTVDHLVPCRSTLLASPDINLQVSPSPLCSCSGSCTSA